MHIDVVFSGGGVKAFTYVGVLQELERKGLCIKRAAGTSAGAIIAACIAAGYSAQEVEDILENLDLERFLDAPMIERFVPYSKWAILFFKKGIYKGDRFEEWLEEILARANLRVFGDLPEGALKIVASDLTLGRLIVFPDDLHAVYGINPDTFPIAKAIRFSAGFPFFFMPAKMLREDGGYSQMVDGGMLSNFPLWVMESSNKIKERPLLGIKILGKPGKQKAKQIKNAYEMCEAMLSTMKTAHDARYVTAKEEKNIMIVPAGDVSTMNLNITQKIKTDLIQNGKVAAAKFLVNWPN